MRRANDFYPTESRLTNGLLSSIGDKIAGSILEPCNGQGHISNILKTKYSIVNTSDIINGSDYYGDATDEMYWKDLNSKISIDWTITNVPFLQALPIIKNSYKYSKLGVAILVRLTFLEPTYDRQDFLDDNAPNIIIVNPRSSFTGDGKTDSVTTCWMIWGKDDIFGHVDYKSIRITRK